MLSAERLDLELVAEMLNADGTDRVHVVHTRDLSSSSALAKPEPECAAEPDIAWDAVCAGPLMCWGRSLGRSSLGWLREAGQIRKRMWSRTNREEGER